MRNKLFADMIFPIVNSKDIHGYAIGLTKNPTTRRSSYKRVGWEYFYIIDIGLSQEKALKLEKQYFDHVTSDHKTIYYKKYHPEKRDENHKASIGGVDKTSKNNSEYSIYVACYA